MKCVICDGAAEGPAFQSGNEGNSLYICRSCLSLPVETIRTGNIGQKLTAVLDDPDRETSRALEAAKQLLALLEHANRALLLRRHAGENGLN